MTLGSRAATLGAVGGVLALVLWIRFDILKNPAGFVAFPLFGLILAMLAGMFVDHLTQGWFEETHVIPWGIGGALIGGLLAAGIIWTEVGTPPAWVLAVAGSGLGVFAGVRKDLREGVFEPWGDRDGTRKHFGGGDALRVERFFNGLREVARGAPDAWPVLARALGRDERKVTDLEGLVLIAGAVVAETYAKNTFDPGSGGKIASLLRHRLGKLNPTAERYRTELESYVWTNLGSVQHGAPDLYGRWILEQIGAEADAQTITALSEQIADTVVSCLDNPLNR
jgi:hypothetical protein